MDKTEVAYDLRQVIADASIMLEWLATRKDVGELFPFQYRALVATMERLRKQLGFNGK